MRLADHSHPDSGLILESLPRLVARLALRLDTAGQSRMCQEDLLKIAHAGMDHAAPYEFWQAGPCLVGLSVARQWWADHPVLYEEFIIRYKGGNFADTITELTEYAKAQGCTSLVISSLAQVRKESYGRYLERKGFTEVARQYMKGII